MKPPIYRVSTAYGRVNLTLSADIGLGVWAEFSTDDAIKLAEKLLNAAQELNDAEKAKLKESTS